MPSSEVWNHFKNMADEGLAMCNICKTTLKNNRLSNLKTHLIKLHKMNLNLRVDYFKASTSSLSTKTIQKKKIKIELNKKELLRSYIGLVTEDSIPFNVLNSQNMRNIVDPICEGLKAADGKKITLNSYNCKKTLETVANNIRAHITSEVKNTLLSLKIDSATRMSRNIFGISAQYISAVQIKSIILGMIELKDGDKNLGAEVIRVLNKYNINLNQIVSITSNNGANMIKTTNILRFVSELNIEEDDEVCTNEDYLMQIDSIETVPRVRIGNIQVCLCAALTAQLVALDVVKSSDILKYLFNCRNLTKYIRKTSNGYRKIFELNKFKMPQLDCPSRWGSTYTMLQHLLDAKDILCKIESIKNKSEEENFDLDSSFWDFIETYCNVFSPLQKTIQKYQEEQLPYSTFYAQWLKLKISTEKIVKDSNQQLAKTIGNQILISIEKRTKTLLNNKFVISCLFLDPRFQHILTSQQRIDAITHLKSIWDRICSLNPTGNLCTMPSSRLHQLQNNFVDEEDALLDAYLAQGVISEVDSTIDVYSKIENLQLPFQRIDTDVLSFWKGKQYTDQELYAISNVCYAVPPTQVSIEREFSTLRHVLADYRNRLSQDVMENALLVKLNPSFLDTAIDTLPLFQNVKKKTSDDSAKS